MDTNNYYYSWYAPITTLIWQNAMHWKLVLLVVYKHDEELTPVLRSILQFTEAAGAEIIYLKNPLKEPQYLTEMVVMQTKSEIPLWDFGLATRYLCHNNRLRYVTTEKVFLQYLC